MSLFTVGNDVGLASDHLNFAVEALEHCGIDGEIVDSLHEAQQRLDQAMEEIEVLRKKYGEA